MIYFGWKFRRIITNEGADTGFMSLCRAPSQEDRETWAFLKQNYKGRLIGFCSYKDFPKSSHKSDVNSNVAAWCHCFKDPASYLPGGVPNLLLSRSDFVNVPIGRYSRYRTKDYDVVYSCLSKSQMHAKNFDLFAECLPIFLNKMGLKVLMIGDSVIHEAVPDHELLTKLPQKSQFEYLKLVAKSRVLFVPSVLDASPRVMTEALSLNVPVLVNEAILGGWKYINSQTGNFFIGKSDVEVKIRPLLSQNFTTRRWFIRNYGPVNAGKRLLSFLSELANEPIRAKYLMIDDPSLGPMRRFRKIAPRMTRPTTGTSGKRRLKRISQMSGDDLYDATGGVAAVEQKLRKVRKRKGDKLSKPKVVKAKSRNRKSNPRSPLRRSGGSTKRLAKMRRRVPRGLK